MIQVLVNSVDKTSDIERSSLNVRQILTSQVDTAHFKVRKYGSKGFLPVFGDDILIYDGSTKIFGGTILKVSESVETGGPGVVYEAECVDYTHELDNELASKTYEDKTISYIISDLLSSYATDFTDNNVICDFTIDKIVFNQIPISECLQRLADIVRYDWYVDADKDIHFFIKEANEAPFDLTDDNGNYVYKSLIRDIDSSQLVNVVKVRGGEYNGNQYQDVITVKGDDSKSFKLPYKMANLVIELDTGGGYVEQDVGIDFIDDFTGYDVLHNFQDKSFRFETALSDGDKIRFTGNPKVRVIGIAEDGTSKALYGKIEKLIRDNSIKDNTTARRRATAELYAYASSIVEAKFRTYTAGLRTGMIINLQSDNRSSDDDLIIKQVVFKAIDPNSFYYDVQLISTKKYNLIALLAKILQPEPLDIDEVEVSESIYSTSEEINIAEEIEMVSPHEADETITITELLQKDPIDPDTLIFVLGPYTPSGPTDTDKPGRLGLSFKVY